MPERTLHVGEARVVCIRPIEDDDPPQAVRIVVANADAKRVLALPGLAIPLFENRAATEDRANARLRLAGVVPAIIRSQRTVLHIPLTNPEVELPFFLRRNSAQLCGQRHSQQQANKHA